MKKHILALAVSGLAATFAHAQSSVTLYGVIDEGFDYTSNSAGHANYQLVTGTTYGSRWGLRGAEDLGGGTKATFWLESGFNINNGASMQGGRLFGRQAAVGLTNNRLGSLSFGRQFDPMTLYVGSTTVTGSWGGLLFAHPFDNDDAAATSRIDNSVKYESPNFNGFQFAGTFGFGNTTAFASNRSYSVAAKYNRNGLLAAVGYLRANTPGMTADGSLPTTGGADFVSEGWQVFGAGVNYTIGSSTVGFAYTNTEVSKPQSSVYVGSISGVDDLRFQNFELNYRYFFRPDFSLGAEYTYTRERVSMGGNDKGLNINAVGGMADYFLSKRTDVYVQAVYQHVGGDGTGTVLDHAYIATTAGGGISSSRNQVVTRVGLRHLF